MANNIVSEWLRRTKRLTYTEQESLATKLDRLVEAAEECKRDIHEHDLEKDYVTLSRVLFDELEAALAAIKLPEAADGGV